MIEINWEKYLDFDAQTPPPGMREHIFVEGTPYEMGRQYGSQTKEMIKRNFCLVAGDALKSYTREQVADRLAVLCADIEDKAPEIHDWYRGIADGAGMTYGEIALINMQLWFSIPEMMCSTIAARGEATESGKTIAGVNGDITYNMSGYGVTMIAFPEKGNAFVTLPQLAGQMGANFAMNEKGLIVTFDGGEAELDEDTEFGFADFISSMVVAVSRCNNAVQAEETIKGLGVACGWIYLLADATGDLRILEHTSSRDLTRFPGDYGEKNYIHAANHFLDPDMRRSSLARELNLDSYLRYDTEEQLLREKLGTLTLENMMDILACPDSWDGETWSRNLWGVEESNYTPEMRAPDFRTGTRGFGVAEDAEAYILHGTADTAVSYMPESMGKYAKIVIRHEPAEVLEHMEEDAMMAAWEAARRLSEEGTASKEQLQILDEAKKHIYAGKNYLAKINIYNTFDAEAARINSGYAASEFEYAYVMAQTV